MKLSTGVAELTSRVVGGMLPTGGAMRRSLVLFNWYAGLRLWYDNIAGVTGFVFVGYALTLGVPKEKIGYLALIATLASLAQLACVVGMNAIADKKRFVILFGYLEPLCYLAMVAAVYLAPPSLRFPVMLLGVLLAAGSVQASSPLLSEWLASSIPPSIRGRYIGMRTFIVSIISIAAMLLIGFTTNHVKTVGSMGYGALLLAGGAMGLLAVRMLHGIAMPAVSAGARFSWAAVPEVLRHAPFIRFLVATIIYNCPFWLAGPYYSVYHLKVLGMSEQMISYMMVGYFTLKIFMLPLVGRWLDRLGVRAMVYLVSPVYVTFFLLYALSSPDRVWMVFLAWALIGVAEAGFGVAVGCALYEVVPESTARPAYFAVYSLMTVLFSALGAAGAVWIVSQMSGATIGGLHFGKFQLLFAIACLMLIPCILGTQLYPGKKSRHIVATEMPTTAG